jgi:hypothetical protein
MYWMYRVHEVDACAGCCPDTHLPATKCMYLFFYFQMVDRGTVDFLLNYEVWFASFPPWFWFL